MLKKWILALTCTILAVGLTAGTFPVGGNIIARVPMTTVIRADESMNSVEAIKNRESKPTPVNIKTKTKTLQRIEDYKKLNSETVGWLFVPGTNIDEVILKRTNDRNYFYLHHNFYKQPLKDGSFFADYRATFGGSGTRNELARNTTLYGHSWDDNANGRLFAQLKRYRNEEFAKTHPYIYFSTEDDIIAWEVFAVLDTHVNFPYVQPNAPDGYTDAQVLEAIKKSSIYNYNVDVKPTDKLLTISTCTYNVEGHSNLPEDTEYRFVIVAKMVPIGTTKKVEASFTKNEKPLSPDTYK